VNIRPGWSKRFSTFLPCPTASKICLSAPGAESKGAFVWQFCSCSGRKLAWVPCGCNLPTGLLTLALLLPKSTCPCCRVLFSPCCRVLFRWIDSKSNLDSPCGCWPLPTHPSVNLDRPTLHKVYGKCTRHIRKVPSCGHRS
jgi:hypothetical protein